MLSDIFLKIVVSCCNDSKKKNTSEKKLISGRSLLAISN